MPNFVKISLITTFGVFAVTMLSGCANQKEVTYSSGGMTQTFPGKDALPKDFALPLYPGATTSGSVAADSTQEENQFLILSTDDSSEKVSAFYEDKLKATGWTVDTVQSGIKIITIDAHKEKLTANIEIADDGEAGKGKTTVSLQWGKSADNIQDPGESAAENYKPDKVNPPTD